MSEQFDVTIIGAGPSGCACALALHNSGLNVALIDKSSFPRIKACGDAIPGKSFSALDHINPTWGKKLRNFSKGAKITKGIYYSINGQKVIKTWKLFSYNCKRIDFDNYLMNLVKSKTDTTIIENNQIYKVTFNEEEITAITIDGDIIKSNLIIGCDGAHSSIKRDLLLKPSNSDDIAVAVMTYFKHIKNLKPGVNEVFHVKDYPNGYFWIFPFNDDVANVGFGILPDKKAKSKTNVKEAFKNIIKQDQNLARRFESAQKLSSIIGAQLPFGGKKNKISGERFMLCGDAASLINPLSGAGIDNAMWSGIFASQQAIKCFKSSNFSSVFMSNYDNAIYRHMGAELKKSYRLMKLITKYPKLVNFALKVIPNLAS